MSSGGIYKGPHGEELHGDGREVYRTPTPPTPATTPATTPKRMAELLRHASSANRERCGLSLTHGYVREIAESLETQDRELAACRAACGLMREVIDVVARADVQGESVGNQILIVKARNALAALADAERAGTAGG
jgi:hypothetical protein